MVRLFWFEFGVRLSAIVAFTPAQMSRAKDAPEAAGSVQNNQTPVHFMAFFTPLDRLLWSEPVEELADSVRFPLSLGMISLRQNVKRTKTYQQKAT